jgi:hypothetical protein
VNNKVRIILNAGTGVGMISSGTYDSKDFPNKISDLPVGNDAGFAFNKLHFRVGVMVALPIDKLEVGLTFRGDLPLAGADYSALAPSVIANASYQIAGANTAKGFQMLGVFGLGWMNFMHRVPFDDCGSNAPVDSAGNIIDNAANANSFVCYNDNWYEADPPDVMTRNGFRKSGFLGVELGLDTYFWLTKNFGFNIGAMLDVLFPTFALNADIQGGVALRF